MLRIIAGPDGLDAGAVPVPLGDPAEVGLRSLRVGVMAGGEDEPVERAVRTLVAAGAEAGARIQDVRSEALDITRRKWGRGSLGGKENERLLWDWDRFRRRLLMATEDIDVLITPAAEPAPPWRESGESDYLWTLPWSLTGAPAVVVPIDAGDPIPAAVQIIARSWQDHVALAVAAALEARVPPAEPGRE